MTRSSPVGTASNYPGFAAEADVARMLHAARCVILDFDGPVCSVFAGAPAPDAAVRMVDLLTERGIELYPHGAPSDPLEVLRDAGRQLPTAVIAALEEELTRHEVRAVETARPTPGAEQAIEVLTAAGRTLAVASNNAKQAVERYLGKAMLAGYFHGGVHGRAAEPALMKPDPDCVRRALEKASAEPSEALMVGDSVTDHEAADRLGVPFLGFAVDRRHAHALSSAGVGAVVASWEPVICAAGDATPAR